MSRRNQSPSLRYHGSFAASTRPKVFGVLLISLKSQVEGGAFSIKVRDQSGEQGSSNACPARLHCQIIL